MKSKSGPRFGDPLEMVTPEKIRRIRRAAEAWLDYRPAVRRAHGSLRRGRGARTAARVHPGGVLTDPQETRRHAEPDRVAATQDALYAELDVELSWSERELPERERTKHVHRLHPYLGKFIPQLVEELLRRHVAAGGRVLDPFAGSGTTLVQALESGHDATGVDLAAFNCLLMRVKTAPLQPVHARARPARCARALRARRGRGGAPTGYVAEWFAPQAAEDLLRFRSLDRRATSTPTCCGSCSPARRARRGCTTHFDLDFPSRPQRDPYWCHKHKRECRPVEQRGALPAPLHARHAPAAEGVRARARAAARRVVLHGDAREVDAGDGFDAVVTSPPYPGLIDYHEQHRYAYELLGLDDLRERELGAAAAGTSREALGRYVDGDRGGARARGAALRRGAPLLIVVNDRRELYPEVLERAGLRLDGPLPAARQPAHRPPRRRVLRGRAGRAAGLASPRAVTTFVTFLH